MPTDFTVSVVAVAVLSSITFLWFIAFTISSRKTKVAFDVLMSDPGQVVDFWRTGPDGDGYNRLNVRSKSGALLVIDHFEADEAERRLSAAGVKQAVFPSKIGA